MYPVYVHIWKKGGIHNVSSVSEDLTLCISHLGVLILLGAQSAWRTPIPNTCKVSWI